MQCPPAPAQDAAIEAILLGSKRPQEALPLRHTLVQVKASGASLPGPLAALVRRGRDSTLEQYLLAHTLASGGEFSVRLSSVVWARALGLTDDEAGRRTVGRNWRILRDLRLVSTERAGREIRVTILDESGSGEPYRHPGQAPAQRYLQLPFSYWRDGYYKRLSLPGKAVLLIAMTLGDWFSLPTRRGPEWYGLSRSTLERGYDNACANGVLERQAQFKAAPLTPQGWTRENYYRLRPPFGPVGAIAKSAHPNFSVPATEPSPAHQRDRNESKSTRRAPAAGTSSTGKARTVGARRKPRSRLPTV